MRLYGVVGVAISTSIVITILGAASLTSAQSNACPFSWNTDLKVGSVGTDVIALQRFLNSDPSTALAQSGIGSSGHETTRFGALTAKAVSEFQKKYASDVLIPSHLSRGTGMVGAFTRAKLNALCKAGGASPQAAAAAVAVDNTPDALTISSVDQPAHTLALKGAGGVPFTTLTLTAGSKDVTVNSVSAERVGPGEDGAFDAVQLNDEENEIGDDQHFDANHKVIFGSSFTVPAHTSKKLTITASMVDDETDFEGQAPVIQVDAIDATSPVVGAQPILGTAQTINNTIEIGGATAALSPFDPGFDSNHYINDRGIRFSGIRLTANSQEDLSLGSITWTQNGTASNEDIENVVTVVNGTAYPTEADGREFTSTFSPAIVVPKGNTIDIYVVGDLKTTGAARTVKFDIQGSDDIDLTGNTYGFDVGVSAGGNTATEGNSVFITSDGTTAGDEGTPFFSASQVTINAGTATMIGR